MSEHVVCPWCGGAGLLAPLGCEHCEGRGNLPSSKPWPEMTATMSRAQCNECLAVGRMEAEWRLEIVEPESHIIRRRASAVWWPWAACRACGHAEKAEAPVR